VLRKTVSRPIGANSVRAFSSFEDLLAARVERGDVRDSADLLGNKPEFLGTMLFDWYKQGQIACVFAQLLARDPSSAAWQSAIVQGSVDPNAIQDVLVQAMDRIEALQLIFPGDGSVAQVVSLIRTLCAHPSWECREIEWMPEEKPDSLLVGLRWLAPSGAYSSWVLGIAPFEPMPFTRRLIGAPFVALVIRAGPPTDYAPSKEENGRLTAHLAHMDDRIGTNQEKRELTRDKTRRAKGALLGAEPRSRARARVTFALPEETRIDLANVFARYAREDDK